MKRIKFLLKNHLFCIVLAYILFYASNISAMEQYPYFDPQQGYGIKNDASPWFDGKDYPFFRVPRNHLASFLQMLHPSLGQVTYGLGQCPVLLKFLRTTMKLHKSVPAK